MLHRFSPTTDSITDGLTADHTTHAGQTTQHNGPIYTQEVTPQEYYGSDYQEYYEDF